MLRVYQNTIQWFRQDLLRLTLLLGGFFYAWFMSQGIPLWDDDFTSWFWKQKDHSIWKYFWEWISPVSTQPEHWGFNERPVQVILYKIFFMISGYEAWSYYLYRSLTIGGLLLLVHAWVKEISGDSKAGFLAAISFLLIPNITALHLIHADFATTSQLVFGVLSFWIWKSVEATPEKWTGFPKFSNPEMKKWLLKWLLISLCVYLSFKTKGSLKFIPVLLGLYVLLMRRRQWKLFAVPIGLMGFLAIPWGPRILSKLPPWFPGSTGSEIAWMYQPASPTRVFDFIFAADNLNFLQSFRETPLSYAGVFGPFLIIGIVTYLVYREATSEEGINLKKPKSTQGRGLVFVALWTLCALALVSMLPELNKSFRVRYGIITMLPASILIGVLIASFLKSFSDVLGGVLPSSVKVDTKLKSNKRNQKKSKTSATSEDSDEVSISLGKKFVFAWVAVLFAAQLGINFYRSLHYRDTMGIVIVSVGQVYDYVNENYPNGNLVLLPDFRPYDYRPDAAPVFRNKKWLPNPAAIHREPAGKTLVISWKPSLADHFELVRYFSGCAESSLHYLIFGCPQNAGVALMKYVGRDKRVIEADQLFSSNYGKSRALLKEYLAEGHGQNLGVRFKLGILAYNLKDFRDMDANFAVLEKSMASHKSVIYNRALALEELGQYDEAIWRHEVILKDEPRNYAVLYHLFTSLQKKGSVHQAKKILEKMKEYFPNDQAVQNLVAQHL